jgi:phospholipid-binding lipoprotein MlaA
MTKFGFHDPRDAGCPQRTGAPAPMGLVPLGLSGGLMALTMLASPAFAEQAPPAASTETAPAPQTATPSLPASITTSPMPAPASASTPVPAPAIADPGIIVISVHSRKYEQRIDPAEAINAKSFGAIQTADKMVIGPASKVYEHGVPGPLRSGIHNVLYNFREPTNFLNFLLQHKVGKAAETLARFTLNSTMGWAGLFDVAKRKPFNLPYRPNGLANTMGFYGIGPGPYMFLPMLGPTTLRDFIGITIDRFSAPAALAGPFATPEYGFSVTVIGGLDDRLRIAPQLAKYRDQVGDPYRATRDFYLRRRQAEIDALRGHPSKPASSPP